MTEEIEEIRELKHSIRTHLLIMAGPSKQLAAFLVKVVDFIEDTDPVRRKNEILALAFSIIESVGIHVHRSIDVRQSKHAEMPDSVKRRGNEILVVIGRCRSIEDKIAAKNTILKVTAEALDALGAYMHATYPTLFDSVGNKLNNFEATSVAQILDGSDED